MKGREERISVRWGWISREKGPLDPMGQGVGYLDLDQSQGFQLDAASQMPCEISMHARLNRWLSVAL